MALLILYRTYIAPEDVPLPDGGNPKPPWSTNPGYSYVREILYKEAPNVIEWALENKLKIEIAFQYDYKSNNYEVAVYSKIYDNYQRMVLELSKPEAVPSNG
jgi:hypothetical protein